MPAPDISVRDKRNLVEQLRRSQIYRDYERAFRDTTGLPLALRAVESFDLPHRGDPKENAFCAMMAGTNRSCSACLQLQKRVEEEARLAPRIARFRPGERPVDRALADYILLHFRLKEPYHAFVRVFLAQMFLDTGRFLPYMVEMQRYIDPPLQSLFAAFGERGALRADMDVPRLILSFKTVHLGLTALWAVEGPPFQQTALVVRQQMQFFTEGILRKPQ